MNGLTLLMKHNIEKAKLKRMSKKEKIKYFNTLDLENE